jgi:hypothetical protein
MDPDQTARMRRLLLVHAGRKPIMLVLSWRGSNTDHLSIQVMFGLSFEWPLFTCLTVYTIYRMFTYILYTGCKNFPEFDPREVKLSEIRNDLDIKYDNNNPNSCLTHIVCGVTNTMRIIGADWTMVFTFLKPTLDCMLGKLSSAFFSFSFFSF